MKKILIIFLMLFSFIKVSALENDTRVSKDYIYGVYYNYEYNGISYWGQMGKIYANSNLVYCIDLNNNINSSIYSSTYDLSINEDIILYSYFGYGYKTNTSINYYLATQQLIWEKLGVNVKYTTFSNGGGNEISVNTYKQEILNNVEKYRSNLNINSNFNYLLGDNIELFVEGSNLNEYLLINNSGNIINMYQNKININTKVEENNTFYLKSNYINKGTNALYFANNSQTLLYVGNVIEKKFEYNYVVDSGKVKINLKSLIDVANSNLSLENNIFYLYDSKNNFIKEFISDKNGNIYIDSLFLGNYTLQHISPSSGYKLLSKSLDINISKTDYNKSIDIFLEPKVINFNITKRYGNPLIPTFIPDPGVSFMFTNSSGVEVGNIVTDYKGEASISLVYDEYKVSQVTSNIQKETKSEYYIRLSDFNGDNWYMPYTPIYESKVRLHFYDKDTQELLLDNEIVFDAAPYIINVDHIDLSYLVEGIHKVKVLENKDFIEEELEFEINENSAFYFENEDIYVDINLYRNKKTVLIEEIPVEDDKTIEEETKTLDNEKLPNLYVYGFELLCLKNYLYY